jgi:CBS domain-containing protein
MIDSAGSRDAARLLEVRTLEVISGRGRSVTLSNVRCPVRGRSAAVEECAHCGRSDGVAQDALARGEWLRCRAEAPAQAAGAGPLVREVMRRTAVATRPGVACSVAAEALRKRGQGAAPVVDGEGRPVGMVGQAELLRARPGARVSEAMARVALSVSEGAPLARAAALMASHQLDRVAVVSADGAVVGVLSALDVVAWLASPAGPLAGPDGAGGQELTPR